MQCAREMGIEDSIASFVLPLAVTVNLSGTALYEAVTVIFIAQARPLASEQAVTQAGPVRGWTCHCSLACWHSSCPRMHAAGHCSALGQLLLCCSRKG